MVHVKHFEWAGRDSNPRRLEPINSIIIGNNVATLALLYSRYAICVQTQSKLFVASILIQCSQRCQALRGQRFLDETFDSVEIRDHGTLQTQMNGILASLGILVHETHVRRLLSFQCASLGNRIERLTFITIQHETSTLDDGSCELAHDVALVGWCEVIITECFRVSTIILVFMFNRFDSRANMRNDKGREP
jgi:hypothetical protein